MSEVPSISPTHQRLNNGKKAPNYQIAREALQNVSPADFDRNGWLAVSGAFYTATEGLESEERRLADWQAWNVPYGEKNDPQGNLATWRDFKRNGTSGDFVTLANMSRHGIAMAWAHFGEGKDLNLSDVSYGSRKFRFERADALRNVKMEWLVKDVMPAHSLSMFFGASGSAKTFGALSCGLSIASGSEWYGRATKQGAVLYVCGEGKAGIKKRIDAWCSHFGKRIERLPFYVSSGAANFTDPISVSQVQEAIEELQINPVLIIIDTLARNMTGDENDTKEMNAFIKALDVLKDKYGSSVLLVHHTGHADQSRARGSSALKGAWDGEFKFEKSGNQVKFSCTKMKDEGEPHPLNFKLIQIPIGDRDNLEVGAVLVPSTSEVIKISPQAQRALEVYKTLEGDISKERFYKSLSDEKVFTGKEESQRRVFNRILGEISARIALSDHS